MGTHIALLRGINVGGRNKVAMKDLAALFGDLVCEDVRTYIQSGNVVFRAEARLTKRISAVVVDAIEDKWGFRVPVVLRTAAEVLAMSSSNPFLEAGADERELHVAFLADTPAADCVTELDPGRFPPDELTAPGREIYLRCPNGMARTKLTNDYCDRKLGTISTLRNWKTVLRLAELAAGG